jgi:hypothetical protein
LHSGAPLCGALPCAWKYRSLPPNQLCQVCGRVLSNADQALGACRDRQCWTTVNARIDRVKQAAREAEYARLKERAEAFCAELTREEAKLRERTLPVTPIPAFRGASRPVPQRRRDTLRRRLERLVQGSEPDQATVITWEEPKIPDSAMPLLQAACTSCRGFCCQNGNDHAYLSLTTIQRVRAARPELSPDEIVEAYLSHVGDRSYVGSCIFHQPTGCGLPREMRSDTCNNFFCDPMRTVIAAVASAPARPVVLVSLESDAIRAAVSFDGDRVKTVRPAPPAARS